ncbi:MAG: ribokinase [Phyllobacterium sp.]
MHAYVIGNVTVDETIAVTRMPEAGASILGRETSRDLGGKGANQAVVLARCGVPTTFIGGIGDDFRSKIIRQELSSEPVDAHLVSLAGRSSDFSMVLSTPDGENAIITTTDSAESLHDADVTRLLAKVNPGDLAVLQGNLSGTTTRAILETARSLGMKTALNPSPLRPFFRDLWPMVDIAFLNKGEALALTGHAGTEAAASLLSRGVREVVLTFGSEGAMLVTRTGSVSAPAMSCPVVDTTGAGDTFMAVALASAALRHTTLDRRAIEDATRASAITVGRSGTRSAFPSVKELAAILAAS